VHVVRHQEAPAYQAPGHVGMAMRCLQGREAGPSDSVWLGVSVIEPCGGTTLAASPVEKFYVVLDGELEVTAQLGGETSTVTLHPMDSCRIAPREQRQLFNRSPQPATVLLVMPCQP
jgi:mannose-6-phosphate isomerase-like protein (cupin superfamily)